MRRLVWLAALALPFQALPWSLPLQPAEILALPLIVVSLARGWRAVWKAPVALDYGVLAWTVAVLLAAAVAVARGVPTDGIPREVAIAIFLMLLYAAVRALPRDARDTAPRALIAGAALACGLGAAGSVASALGVDTQLAFAANRPYPYLGHAPQARALTPMPNMLASIAMTALVLLASGSANQSARAAVSLGAVVSLGFALTFSKTALPLGVALTIVALLRMTGARFTRAALRASVVTTLLTGLGYVGVSHLLVLPAEADRRDFDEILRFTGGPPLLEWRFFEGRHVAVRTSYFFNKQMSLEAIRRSFPFGIGPGQQPAFAARLKLDGIHPDARHVLTEAPHSSYTGTLAELGLPGAIGLVVLGAAGFWTLRERFRGGRRGTPLDVAAAGMTAAVLIEVLATDVMHFRHYAWLLALFASGSSASNAALAQRFEGDDADGSREVQRA